jgi:hypothetical protein
MIDPTLIWVTTTVMTAGLICGVIYQLNRL